MVDTPDRADGPDDLARRTEGELPPETEDVRNLPPEEVCKLAHELRTQQLALEESERKLRSLFDNMHSGFAYHEVITDRQGEPIDYVFLEVNAAFERMTGLEGTDIVGKRVTEVHPGIENSEFDWIGTYGKVALTGEPAESEQYFPPQEHWYKISAYSPELGFFACVVDDITEHKLALEKRGAALAQARQRQNEVAALLSGARAVLDCHTFEDAARRIFDACTELIGATSGYVALLSNDGQENEVLFLEAGGLPCTVDPELPMPIRGLRGEAYERGKVVYDNDFANSEWMQFMPEGHVRLDNVLFAPLAIRGETVGLMGIANKPGGFDDHDAAMARAFGELAAIALRQVRDEEALRDSEQRFRTLTRLAPVGVYLTDALGNCLYANEQWLRTAGLELDQALGEGWVQGIHPDDRARVASAWREAVETQSQWAEEYRFQTPGGKTTWVLGLATALLGPEGEATGYIGSNMDITDRRRLEDQLREASKMEAVGRLAGGIAHEFNNLLMGIIGYTDFVHKRVNDLALESDLSQVRNLVDRGASLTQQLLAFGRKQRLEWKVLDLSQHLESTCRTLPRLIGEHIDLQCSFAPDAGAVNADPAQITQVLIDLALNARDAMPQGGTLTVSTANATLDADYVRDHPEAEAGEYVTFSVADAGSGMDEETLAHIFEPFYTTKEVGEGTGLGLATIYGIVKQHGGYVAVDSELGAGSAFRVYLPRVADTPEPVPSGPPRSTRPGGQEVVLLVEDEPAVKDVASRVLRERGYQVLVAANADEAESVAHQHDGAIHLLLTDVVMPGRSGHDLYAALLNTHPALKVLFMSGYDEQSVVVRDVQAAGLPFIAKPMDVHELAEKVREVLDG